MGLHSSLSFPLLVTVAAVLAVPSPKKKIVGRLLHEGGVRVGPFPDFPNIKASTATRPENEQNPNLQLATSLTFEGCTILP